ncbi:Uncharacterised protein [Candidatus Anstonella stagnisolia]|nr:Uncharacterised protein [Candidatus Anstonella stagnisolia]
MRKIYALILFALLASEAFASVLVTPNPANKTNILNVSITAVGGSPTYFYRWRNWTATLRDWNSSGSPSAVLDCNAYSGCEGGVFADVVVQVSGVNSTPQTNKTLVFSTTQGAYQQSYFEGLVWDYYAAAQQLVLGIIILGIAYYLGGAAAKAEIFAVYKLDTMSGTAMIAGVMYFAAFIIFGIPVFVYGSIALLVVGFLLKYIGA